MKACWILLALAACDGGGGDASSPDARTVAPGADAGACGGDAQLTATLTDFDGTPIAGAVFSLADGAAETATTDATGTFSLCLCVPVSNVPYRLLLDAPGDYLDGDVYLEAPVTYDRPLHAMTAAQLAGFATLDATRGHVLVLQTVDSTALTMDAEHDAPRTYYADDTWRPGTDGRYVLFSNVEAETATVMVHEGPSLDPPGYGTTDHEIVVAPGRLSLAVIQAAYE